MEEGCDIFVLLDGGASESEAGGGIDGGFSQKLALDTMDNEKIMVTIIIIIGIMMVTHIISRSCTQFEW